MIKVFGDDAFRGDRSPAFNRSVAEAAGELLMLAEQYGAQVSKMSFADEDGVKAPGSFRGALESFGRAHWDGSQLPHATDWVINFGAAGAGAGALRAWQFLKNAKIIDRLKTLALLKRVTIQAPELTVEITGLVTVEEARNQFERLACGQSSSGKAGGKTWDDQADQLLASGDGKSKLAVKRAGVAKKMVKKAAASRKKSGAARKTVKKSAAPRKKSGAVKNKAGAAKKTAKRKAT